MSKITDVIFIQRVIWSIDNCEGIEVPYPTAKRMFEVRKELKEYLEILVENEEKK